MLLKVAISILCFAALVACQFEIDYDNNTFLMDGKPFRYISGSVHYFRMPRHHWRDRLSKLKAAGLNAVSTYVEWSQHEKEIGDFDFTGNLNIVEFIQTAQEEGLYVILRVGPYICAERTMGGFPYWLLREDPDIKLRQTDPTYQKYIEKWLNVFLPIVTPLLFGNGGPIITLQVENEYGFYGACDHDYTSWLAGIFQKHVQNKAVLFTTDGSDALSCGKIPGVYATVDFGPGANVTEIYLKHKAVEPKGPFVNSEFYPGWLTHWGERWATRDTEDVIKTLKEILDIGGNVNFYMFYGGTNFGFSAGANDGPYTSDVTSYDYDAPISEAGDLTPKYLRIREFLLDYLSINTTLPENPTKSDLTTVVLKKTAFFPSYGWQDLFGRSGVEEYPLSFEDVSQDEGYVFYETLFQSKGGTNLTMEMDARDIATVFLNFKFVGKLSREQKTTSLHNLDIPYGSIIGILVENGGRINNGGTNNDRKGILSNVTIGGEVVTPWVMTAFNFDDIYEKLQGCGNSCTYGDRFVAYTGTFTANTLSNIEYDGEVLLADSFLDMCKLTKGLVFINGVNLGRYWSTRGPQYSLYVPGSYLKKAPDANTIVIIDEEINQDSITVSFSNAPIIGDPK